PCLRDVPVLRPEAGGRDPAQAGQDVPRRLLRADVRGARAVLYGSLHLPEGKLRGAVFAPDAPCAVPGLAAADRAGMTLAILHIITGLGEGGAEAVLTRLCLNAQHHRHVVV